MKWVNSQTQELQLISPRQLHKCTLTYTGLAKSPGSNMVQREILPNYVKLCTAVIVTKHTSGIRMRMKLFSFETKNDLNKDVKGQ